MYIVRQFYYLNFQVLPFRFWELYLTSWCLSIIEKLKHACSKTKILRCVSSLSFVFFWVIPRRLIYICRRFGTLSVPSSKAPAFEDGTDRVFRNVGIYKSDAGESPKWKQTTFWTWRKLEIKNYLIKFTNLECRLVHTISVSGSAQCEVSAVVNCASSVKEYSVQNQIDFLHRNK